MTFHSRIFNGMKHNICESTNVDYYNLSFFTFFSAKETSSFIDDLNRCIMHKFNISDFYLSDSVENIYTIEYKYPNMVIDDGIVIIPMIDLKELLQDWLTFITQ